MTQQRSIERCPFLQTGGTDGAPGRAAEFQCRLRTGRARVPSRDEVAWFCTNGAFRACPSVRRESRDRAPQRQIGAA